MRSVPGIFTAVLSIILLVLLAVPGFLYFEIDTESEASAVVEISGSSSAAPLLEYMAREYMRDGSRGSIRVNGTGSTDGIRSAIEGVADFGMSSRELTPEETAENLTAATITYDAVAIVVHPDRPVYSLSLEEAADIYRGNGTDEPFGDEPAVVSREPGSGTRGAFEEALDFAGYLRHGAIELDGNAAVRAAVARNPAAIGYISMGFLIPQVRALTINGVQPSPETAANGRYPIVRPFLLVYRDSGLTAAARRFLDWALSPAGQSTAAGYWTTGGRSYD